jgi:hypothetical protein
MHNPFACLVAFLLCVSCGCSSTKYCRPLSKSDWSSYGRTFAWRIADKASATYRDSAADEEKDLSQYGTAVACEGVLLLIGVYVFPKYRASLFEAVTVVSIINVGANVSAAVSQ